MTGKQFSIWVLAGCVGAGSMTGNVRIIQAADEEMWYEGEENGKWEQEYQGESYDTYAPEQPPMDAQSPEEGQPPLDEQRPEPDAWMPEGEERAGSYREASYLHAGNAEEYFAEDTAETEEWHDYKNDLYISIRNTDTVKFTEDFEILTKEDAEQAFNLLSYEELPAAVSLDVPEVLQLPELPTGCESIALTMALQYEGFELEKTTIAREFLIYNQETDNMAEGYIGDPFSEEGAGCFAPALAATAESFFEDQEYTYSAYNITGSDMEELLSYVAAGTPVILWGTMYMAEPEFTEDTAEYEGKIYRWYYSEHCMVLSGYDLERQILQINDPLEGIVERDYTEFQRIYDMVGQHAVVLKDDMEETTDSKDTGEIHLAMTETDTEQIGVQ